MIRECRSCVHSCNHTAPTCFSETATGLLQASRHLPAPLARRCVWWAAKCMYQIWCSYLWGIVGTQQTTWEMRVIFFATGLKLASDANNATKVWSLNMTYTPTAKRQLDPGRASRNTFTAPLWDMGCKLYLSELVLIPSRHCWYPGKQITLPERYVHYIWQIHLPSKRQRQLNPGGASRNTFTAPLLQSRRVWDELQSACIKFSAQTNQARLTSTIT